MSQMATSASSSEKSASASVLKLRSCVVCRSRKVRCDKQLPCSNCRRANIACVFPGPLGDRPPRWAHRLDRGTINVEASRPAASQEHPAALADVMNRLRDLETIVQDFRGQLDQEHSMAQSSAGDLAQAEEVEHATPDWVSKPGSHGSPTSITGSLHQRPGRLVGQDNNRNRYVTSGFWSVVNDEVSSNG